MLTEEPATATLRMPLLGSSAPPQTTPPKERPYVLPATIEDEPISRTMIELDPPPKRTRALNPSTVFRRKGRPR